MVNIMQQLIQYVEQLVPRGMDFILSLAIGIIVFFVGSKLIKKLLKIVRRSMEKREMDPGVISFFLSASKITLYVFLVIIVAQIFGFAASSIIAIVGSAGLAIGLALQGSLANFAGGVLILIMKPFCVGDYIIVGDVEGVVQKIDVVYTTLTTADNRAVILPNGKLADSNIVNATKERYNVHQQQNCDICRMLWNCLFLCRYSYGQRRLNCMIHQTLQRLREFLTFLLNPYHIE